MIFPYKCKSCGIVEDRNIMSDFRDEQYCNCGAKLIRDFSRSNVAIPQTIFDSQFSNTHEKYRDMESKGMVPISNISKSIAYVEKKQKEIKDKNDKNKKDIFSKGAKVLASTKGLKEKIVAELKTGKSETAARIGAEIGDKK